ncbi:MAG: DUF4392 domain-containing protein [Hyphomicrobiales bacterium]|nr:DUF4392 domain-containing protein [Hyphomicrobiales bacterium]
MEVVAYDAIDKVQCVEMRRRGLPRGHKWDLYELARETENEPLVLAAARKLVGDRKHVGILTGAAVPEHMPKGENDGPFGAVVLARALLMLGNKVTIITDPEPAPAIEALLAFLKLDVPVAVFELGTADRQAEFAAKLDALVTIERLGGNGNGHLHGISGVSRDSFRVNFDALVNEANRLGKVTIGIGDGGNEIGFGKIYEALKTRLPELNNESKTPCGGGIFSVVATGTLVIGSTSNLGAYGLCAALAMLSNNTELCHTPESEIALHYIGVGLGMSDGGTGRCIADCDGIPAETNAAVVQMMKTIVEMELSPPRQRAF